MPLVTRSAVRKARRPNRRRPGIESLESRDLLAYVIDLGTHVLARDTAGQVIEIHSTASNPAVDDPVTGMNLRVAVGDGAGGATAEPAVTGVDFTGGIWDAFDTTVSGDINPDPSVVESHVVFTNTGENVEGTGLVAKITVSTVGLTSGSFPFVIEGAPLTANSNFILFGGVTVVPVVTDGVIVVGNPWQNPGPEASDRFDVDDKGGVVPLDALILINELNTNGSRDLPIPPDREIPPYLDVNDDLRITPLDALQVINFLNDPTGNVPDGESDIVLREDSPEAGGADAAASPPVLRIDEREFPTPVEIPEGEAASEQIAVKQYEGQVDLAISQIETDDWLGTIS